MGSGKKKMSHLSGYHVATRNDNSARIVHIESDMHLSFMPFVHLICVLTLPCAHFLRLHQQFGFFFLFFFAFFILFYYSLWTFDRHTPLCGVWSDWAASKINGNITKMGTRHIGHLFSHDLCQCFNCHLDIVCAVFFSFAFIFFFFNYIFFIGSIIFYTFDPVVCTSINIINGKRCLFPFKQRQKVYSTIN